MHLVWSCCRWVPGGDVTWLRRQGAHHETLQGDHAECIEPSLDAGQPCPVCQTPVQRLRTAAEPADYRRFSTRKGRSPQRLGSG